MSRTATSHPAPGASDAAIAHAAVPARPKRIARECGPRDRQRAALEDQRKRRQIDADDRAAPAEPDMTGGRLAGSCRDVWIEAVRISGPR
jgi:hypothetical protein